MKKPAKRHPGGRPKLPKEDRLQVLTIRLSRQTIREVDRFRGAVSRVRYLRDVIESNITPRYGDGK